MLGWGFEGCGHVGFWGFEGCGHGMVCGLRGGWVLMMRQTTCLVMHQGLLAVRGHVHGAAVWGCGGVPGCEG